MCLLVHYRDAPQKVVVRQVKFWIETLYVQVYERAPDDPRISKMIEELPGTLRLV